MLQIDSLEQIGAPRLRRLAGALELPEWIRRGGDEGITVMAMGENMGIGSNLQDGFRVRAARRRGRAGSVAMSRSARGGTT